MFVVMQAGAEEAQIQTVIDRLVELGFSVHRSTGVVHTVLGGVGPVDNIDLADFEVMDGVKECHRIMSPYKLASRQFRPGGTVIKIRDVDIGGPKVVVMAGPCSIESPAQIDAAAAAVARSGARSGELASALPRYAMLKTKIECPAARGREVIRALKTEAPAARASLEDGLRLDWDDRWVHLRASNTEPVMRIIAEAKTQEAAQALVEEYTARVRAALGS